MSLRILLLAVFATAAIVATAPAAGTSSLTLRTSLGPVTGEDERPLRAAGRAPRGSRVFVRFYRGSKRLATRRLTPDGRRYESEHPIDRTGGYRVVVVATTPAGRRLRVSAKLRYGPKAEAPSAPSP